MMEAAPPAPFEVPKPDFLLEFLIVPLDTPAQLGKVDELAEADIGWQRRQPTNCKPTAVREFILCVIANAAKQSIGQDS